MNRKNTIRYYSALLSLLLLLSGRGEKSECELPTRHVHKYTKRANNGITITRYIESEDLRLQGYKWNEDHININTIDADRFKELEGKKLFNCDRNSNLCEDNWNYLCNLMRNNHDWLEFYYHYTELVTKTRTNSDGDLETYTETETHSGWTTDPDYVHNTGEVRLYHHRYCGYRFIFENGEFKLDRSKAVDDIQDIIDDYPYFGEKCAVHVYKDFSFNTRDLSNLSPDQFDVFDQPNLDTLDDEGFILTQ